VTRDDRPAGDTKSPEGLLRFARYAYPPNQLGFCGPGDHASLLGYLSEGRVDTGLSELAQRFEGAYPYLRLIAGTCRIGDPFDPRVVEAYWVGNELLERVGAAPFFESLVSRFRGRMEPRSFSWLASVLPRGAKPHHNFHVFDIYRRAGLLRDERATVALDRMDQCRISWGRVLRVEGAEVVIDRAPLVLRAGKLVLGPPAASRVLRPIAPGGAPQELRPGDTVSVHWNWACERLDGRELGGLMRATRRAVAHANLTL
jgi:hypothetical protein